MAARPYDRRRLFWLGVLALFTAAASASIRAAIASSLKAQWIDPVAPIQAGEMIGSALGSAFLGFAITLFVTSAFLDTIGMRRMLLGCGVCFVVGTGMIVGAGSLATGMGIYHLVWAGMLLSGIGWGLAEATINPLTARLYPEETTHRLNLLHAWYPGGLIVGGLSGFFLSSALPWQGIMALVFVPAIGVILIAATTSFPPPVRREQGTSFGTMIGEVFRRPSFFVWFGAMFLTASSELAPGQWIDVALSNRVGMRGILLLVYVSALMFVFRHFAGKIAGRLSNPGLLWVSSLLAAIGLFMLSRAQSPVAAILASTVWGLGVCAMWPTMLASVAERYPRGGAWAMGLVGSAGALASFFVLPQLGAMFDEAKIAYAGGPEAFERLTGAALRQVEDAAASASFAKLAIVPVILLIVFGAIWLSGAWPGPAGGDDGRGCMSLSRRSVLTAGAVATGAVALGAATAAATAPHFSLHYAPHEGSFASRGGRIEQIAFAADQGFTAWEDNEAGTRPVAEQVAMAKALRQRNMTMGVFVASMPKWSQFRPLLGGNDDAEREGFLADIRASVAVAKRLDARCMTVVTGFMDRKLPVEIQTGRIIDVMRRAAEIVEPHKLVMVMEPLNTRTNHPGVYMQSIAQGYAVAKGVNSPAVKVLADLYHEQIQSGNLIPTLETCWDEIGYIQFGDNPGRNEPGTGEIHYQNIVRRLRARNYAGVIGMEHGNQVDGRAGEDRLIAAYRAIDRA